jgi:hypothetical protein
MSTAAIVFADNQVDGFRGDKWGCAMSSINGLDAYSNKFDINRKQTGIFRPSKSEKGTKVGEALLDETIMYFFDDNEKFYGVFCETMHSSIYTHAPLNNGELLIEALNGKFGKPDRVIKTSNNTQRYFWMGRTVAVAELNSFTNKGITSTSARLNLLDSASTYAKDFLASKGFMPEGL